MGMESFGLNKEAQNKSEIFENNSAEGSKEEFDEQINLEVSKLDKNIDEVESGLNELGGINGLLEKITKLSPEAQARIKDLKGMAMFKFAFGALVVGISANEFGASPIDSVAIGAIGGTIAIIKEVRMMLSQKYYEKVKDEDWEEWKSGRRDTDNGNKVKSQVKYWDQ